MRHLHLGQPPGLPELQLYLADDFDALWQDMAAGSEQNEAPPPFWSAVWVGGQALARYLLDGREALEGSSVLDLAAGSGLVGIAAALAGAASVLMADTDPQALTAIQRNAAVNGVYVAVTSRDLLGRDPPPVDLILAGDVCYERNIAARMLPWLRGAHRGGTRVLIGDPGRPHFAGEGLVPLAEYAVPAILDLEDEAVKLTGVWTFEPE